MAAAGANESNKLRQLILQSLYPSSSDNSVPTDVMILIDNYFVIHCEIDNTDSTSVQIGIPSCQVKGHQ